MKLKLLSAAVFGLAVASAGVNAAESEKKVVAKVLDQEKQVLAENSEGSRRLLTQGSEIFDNEYLIVPEAASIELQYVSSQCKVVHGANSLVTVTEAAQCSGNQQIAVGQATVEVNAGRVNAAGGSFGSTTTAQTARSAGATVWQSIPLLSGATVGQSLPLGFSALMFTVTATAAESTNTP